MKKRRSATRKGLPLPRSEIERFVRLPYASQLEMLLGPRPPLARREVHSSKELRAIWRKLGVK